MASFYSARSGGGKREVVRMFFMDEKGHYLLTTENVETLMEYWNNYHMYRYDIYVSFDTFLRENGLDVRVASPDLRPFGYSIKDVEISLN